MFTIHKKCHHCDIIGHKDEMKSYTIHHIFGRKKVTLWYHKECFMKCYNCLEKVDVNGNKVWVKNEN